MFSICALFVVFYSEHAVISFASSKRISLTGSETTFVTDIVPPLSVFTAWPLAMALGMLRKALGVQEASAALLTFPPACGVRIIAPRVPVFKDLHLYLLHLLAQWFPPLEAVSISCVKSTRPVIISAHL